MIRHSQPTIPKSTRAALERVLADSYLGEGKEVDAFERELARFMGIRYALATNTGISALHLALCALGVQPGDEIIMPSYVCTALLNAVNYVGATPKLVDISHLDYNIDLPLARKQIARKVKALIIPHSFGKVADVRAFAQFGIPVIEDCAQAIGAKFQGKRVGRFGTVSIFSFYATKMMATGFGGALATSSAALFRRVQDLKDFDEREDYRVRYNYKMSDLNAAVGRVQLRQIDQFIQRRKRLAAIYDRYLAPFKRLGTGLDNVYQRYIIEVPKRLGSVIQYLRRNGIEAKRPIFKPLHVYLGLSGKRFPQTEHAWRQALSLPIYPSLMDAHAHRIGRLTRDFIEEL